MQRPASKLRHCGVTACCNKTPPNNLVSKKLRKITEQSSTWMKPQNSATAWNRRSLVNQVHQNRQQSKVFPQMFRLEFSSVTEIGKKKRKCWYSIFQIVLKCCETLLLKLTFLLLTLRARTILCLFSSFLGRTIAHHHFVPRAHLQRQLSLFPKITENSTHLHITNLYVQVPHQIYQFISISSKYYFS